MTNTQHMQPRLDYAKAAPGAREAMYAVERYVRECGLERRLLELVKLRASQINGCAYCVDMHAKDARAHGETEQRLYAVVVWRETPFFTERERAALVWTGSNCHQRMEPPGHQFSRGSRNLSARGAAGRSQGGVKCSF